MERREQGDGRSRRCNSVLHLPTLADLGLDRMEASRCQRIAEVPMPRDAGACLQTDFASASSRAAPLA